MSEPSRLHVKVASESHRKKTRLTRLVTLDLVISWIHKLELDEYTIKGLIDVASRYPAAALPSFRKNINLMIQRVRAQRQKDMQGEENVQPEFETPIVEFDGIVTKAFDTGPQKTDITADDLKDEWEIENIPQIESIIDENADSEGI